MSTLVAWSRGPDGAAEGAGDGGATAARARGSILQPIPTFHNLLAGTARQTPGWPILRRRPPNGFGRGFLTGSIIKEHRDDGVAFEFGVVRLHIPVATNPAVKFLLNGTRVVMEPGSVWCLRLSDPHGAANEGASDRVHLVLDLAANDWLESMLNRSAPC